MGLSISNPNVLDLSEWQKVITEVNNLSKRLDAITNKYGTGIGDSAAWTTPNFSKEFNLGTHKIIFGKEKFVFADNTIDRGFYAGDISFNTSDGVTVFSQLPIITATIQFTGATMPTNNKNIMVTIYKATKDGFSYRVANPATSGSSDWSGQFYVNYIAIGPQ